MGDRFHPISMEQLTDWVFDELEAKDSIFGVPRAAFFVPADDDRFKVELYDRTLETPFGVAAGPHTQMAQNIIVSWLLGARLIELKTIQTLDELEIAKPCIDVEDEGYNVEWSQELLIDQSIDEYVRAWVLVHALHKVLGHPTDGPGTLFNMSVGYDLEGVKSPSVRRFIDTMLDAGVLVEQHLASVVEQVPALAGLEVPHRFSDSVTLSTMHGCPPQEIGRISSFLMDVWGLHTSV